MALRAAVSCHSWSPPGTCPRMQGRSWLLCAQSAVPSGSLRAGQSSPSQRGRPWSGLPHLPLLTQQGGGPGAALPGELLDLLPPPGRGAHSAPPPGGGDAPS